MSGIAVTTRLQETLTPSQAKILQSLIPYLWIRAGYGAGKTRNIAQFVTQEMLIFPGCYGCCYNNTGSQLDSSTWDTIKIYWLEKGIPWIGPDKNSIVTLPNGSRLKLQTMAVRNEQLLAGPEWSFIAIDEAHLMKQAYWDVVKVRARRKNGSRKVRVYGLSVSPGNYLVDEFCTSGKTGYGSIEFTTYENKANMPEGQIAKYEAMFPKGTALHDRYMLGMITAVEGTCYSMLVNNLEDYLVDDADVPTVGMVAAYGQDLGVIDPHVLLEGKVGCGDTLYITREYYVAGLDINQHIPSLKVMYEQGAPVFSDHSATQHSIMRTAGFNMVKAFKEVDPGIQLVHNRINLKAIKIARSCVHLIKELCLYQIKALPSGKEVPVHEHSHCPDALRYLIAGIDQPSLFN